MTPIVRARLQLALLPIMPRLPMWLQVRIWWWLAPPGFAEQADENLRRALARTRADIFQPDETSR